MRRSQLFWGSALLLWGLFLLFDQMGLRLPNGNSISSLFWPLALLLAGGWVLLGVFMRGKIEDENASIDLQGASSAHVRINHGAGELKLHGGASPSEVARGTFAGGLNQKSTRNGDSLDVRMKPAKEFVDFPFFGGGNQLDWDVALNANLPMALTMNLGANKAALDLRDLTITDLKLETGASETKLTLPSRGRFRADLDLGAASLEVIVPAGVSARIRATVGAVDLKVDESRFPRSGGYYQSQDYDTAANAVDLSVDAGAASVKIS
ncbi:MAG TPA: toast rack family protein [Anaerolineales bacterium]|nr:toast rack family protein [Anaerolineales bacterium]HMV98165.1 toast rack family protein [Anaerolineales bacterium]HMX19862.1 toast rack family protein [Anaerolineales bacterium]HMX75430.1 toast rack family protein [Anaerolineales bacterium]HMZ42714.1 toast rack family protein [Anaerolineales bacterium]